MGDPDLRWTDAPEFHWSPDEPFRAESQTRAGVSFADEPVAPPEPANSAPSYLLTRLVVGALQGLGLVLLAAGHGSSALSSSLSMVMLFAPLLLLAGFGRIPGKLLLPWTALASIAVAAMGIWQFWRGPDALGGNAIVLAALFLFIGQSLVTAWARDGEPLASYRAFHDGAWSVALLIGLCALAAGITAVIAGAACNWLRQYYPGSHMLPVTPVVTLAVACMSWLLSPPRLRPLVRGLVIALAFTLPSLTLLAAALAVAALLQHWQPPLLLDLALALGMLVCINASYRAGEERPAWQQNFETAGSVALAVLVALAWLALAARVADQGWTRPRIFAAATVGMLALYAAAYVASALISLGGGGWMQRIERANLGLALALLALIVALASPLG